MQAILPRQFELIADRWIPASWSLIFLGGLISSVFLSFTIVGYRWSAEMIAGSLVLATGAWLITCPTRTFEFGRAEFSAFILPVVLLVIWSTISIAWSSSTRSALHHTLLWGCYAVFYMFVRQTVSSDEEKDSSLMFLGAVILIIGSVCLIEFFGNPGALPKSFNSRYYLFSEAFVPFLPIFLAVGITREGLGSRLAFLVAALIWMITLATASRAMFLAGIVGIGAFGLLILIRRVSFSGRRLAFAFGVLSVLTLFAFVPLDQRRSVTSRLSESDQRSVESASSRLLFWGLAIEALRTSPAVGIGAGNYPTRYRDLKQTFAANYAMSPVTGFTEDFVPDRAHNEYLQVLAELGVVGFIFFISFIAGAVYLFARQETPSITSLAAFAGILAFLCSSAVSSYSFRFPTSGMSFFFLVALALPYERTRRAFSKRWIVGILLIPICLIAFSGVRGASIYYFAQAHSEPNPQIAEDLVQTAMRIDPSEPIFRDFYGQMLNSLGRHEDALPHVRFAIDHGLANSTTYFGLSTTNILLGRVDEAEKTFQESIRVHPRSIFLRSAYAAFLKKNGRDFDAEEQFRAASDIDMGQSRSWRIAHEKGLHNLATTASVQAGLLRVDELSPSKGPLVLMNFESVLAGQSHAQLTSTDY